MEQKKREGKQRFLKWGGQADALKRGLEPPHETNLMLPWRKKISVSSCSDIKCRLKILSSVANVWRCVGLKIALALQLKIHIRLYTWEIIEVDALHQIYTDCKEM